MEIKDMSIDELEARKAEIAVEVDNDGADLDALETEARSIKEEIESRKAAEAKKAEIRSAVALGEGVTVEKIEPEVRTMPTIEEVRNSKEYIDARKEFVNCIFMTPICLGLPLFLAFLEWMPIMRAERRKERTPAAA